MARRIATACLHSWTRRACPRCSRALEQPGWCLLPRSRPRYRDPGHIDGEVAQVRRFLAEPKSPPTAARTLPQTTTCDSPRSGTRPQAREPFQPAFSQFNRACRCFEQVLRDPLARRWWGSDTGPSGSLVGCVSKFCAEANEQICHPAEAGTKWLVWPPPRLPSRRRQPHPPQKRESDSAKCHAFPHSGPPLGA